MELFKQQRGASLSSVVFTLFLIGFATFTTLKLFPVYLEDFSIRSSLESLEADATQEYRGALSVRDAVLKRFDVNDVRRVGKDDLSIIRDGNAYQVNVQYEVIVPFISNVSLLIRFNHNATVRASI